jgi:prevent-host-death family protein
MTNTMPLFEAKAHLSDIVRQVAEGGQEVLVTVRGKPMVRIVPATSVFTADAWEVREKVARAYGSPDFVLPSTVTGLPRDPFADEKPR